MPRTNLLKLGAAAGAALAGVILAITSVTAHSTQASTLHQSSKSVVGTVIQAARVASFSLFQPEAPLSARLNSIELETEADAAELLAAQEKAAAEAAELAAEQAAAAAEAAAEAAAATCSSTDLTEDATEKAAAEAAEAAATPGAEDQAELVPDADLTADTTEAACAGGENHNDHESDQGADHEHTSDGSGHEGGESKKGD